MQPRLTLNFWFSHFYLQGAGTASVCQSSFQWKLPLPRHKSCEQGDFLLSITTDPNKHFGNEHVNMVNVSPTGQPQWFCGCVEGLPRIPPTCRSLVPAWGVRPSTHSGDGQAGAPAGFPSFSLAIGEELAYVTHGACLRSLAHSAL